MKKVIFLGLVVSVGVLLGVGQASAWEGTNNVPVTKCEQVSNGVKLTRFGKTYTLTNGVRDAGHGYRNYNLTCVSATMYRVQWNQAQAPADSVYPSVTLKSLGKNLKSNNYDASFEVSASDQDSAIVKVKAYLGNGTGYYTLGTVVYNWTDQNATAKNTTKSFVVSNLNYNTSYTLTVEVTDKAGNINYVSKVLNQTKIVQDQDNPSVTLNVETKNKKTNNYDLTLKVSASDNTSAITKIKVYVNGPGYSGWGTAYTWVDDTSTAKTVSKTFTLSNLQYSSQYNFYAEVFDKSGRSSTVSLFNVIEGPVVVACDTSVSGYGIYTLCPNQAMLHTPSNTILKNIFVGSNGLLLQVNANASNILFFSTIGEQKTVQGLGGTSIKVKFNGYDAQGDAFVAISQS